MNNKADNVLTLQDALDCVKQYEKHLQSEKRKIINIAYKQGQILHQFKESEEFIDTLVKRLKISKSIITFKINLYKLLKNILYQNIPTNQCITLKTFFDRLS